MRKADPRKNKYKKLGFPVLGQGLLRPTPMIAQWVDWVLGNADRPQPELALLAACVGIGGIIGREMTWKHSHANVYGIGLASSGSGKDTPLHSVAEVYKAAGFSDLLGASRMDNDGGILKAITLKNSIVWPLDEVGFLFENMGRRDCPAGVRDIMQYLLELYSCKPHAGIEARKVPRVPITAPFPCILSFTQPETFASVFNDRMADNGFIGRFIPFLGDDLPPANLDAKRDPPPQSLIDLLRTPRKRWRKNLVTDDKREIHHDSFVVTYNRKAAALVDEKTQRMKGLDRIMATLMARTMEKAQKLALIHAWSLDPADPMMTNASIDWGFKVVEYSNECMKYITSERSSNPDVAMVEMIYKKIHAAGPKGLQHSVLSKGRPATHARIKWSIAVLANDDRILITGHAKVTTGEEMLRYTATVFINSSKAQ